MKFLQNILIKIALIGIIAISSGAVLTTAATSHSMNEPNNDDIYVRLLYNAGVMIETEDTRIYIDPYNLPANYSDYPADVIFITHDHGDHYDPTSINIIRTDDTSFYFPAIMLSEASLYGATSVKPEDTFLINTINITCFYMYTMPDSPDSSHPQENNYTSYIIDIDGFKLFHAGDSWNIDEYEQLTGEIDLVFLPLGPGCQTMTGADVVSVITTIEPSYFIPIHFGEDAKETFITSYEGMIEYSGCELIDLDYYESYIFGLSGSTSSDNGSNSNIPGFSLNATIVVGIFAVIIIKRNKNM